MLSVIIIDIMNNDIMNNDIMIYTINDINIYTIIYRNMFELLLFSILVGGLVYCYYYDE